METAKVATKMAEALRGNLLKERSNEELKKPNSHKTRAHSVQ